MEKQMLKKKRNLKDGDIIPLYFDEAFKIMFANPNHLEILTLLLSRILKVEYKEIVGTVELAPLSIPNRTLGEKKTERDVVVSFKSSDKYKIILEVNVKPKFYQSVIDRNIFYMQEVASNGFEEGEDFQTMEVTFLVNFNTFYVDEIHKKTLDEYLLRNEEGYVLTKKQRVLNINIVECYNLWYHNNYQGKFEPYEEDLMLLSAAMYVTKKNDFERILDQVRTKPEIKELMEGVLSEMTEDEKMWGRFYNKEEEEAKILQGIVVEERAAAKEEGIQEKEKEVIINMYNQNMDIDLISSCVNLSIQEVETIIQEYISSKKNSKN